MALDHLNLVYINTFLYSQRGWFHKSLMVKTHSYFTDSSLTKLVAFLSEGHELDTNIVQLTCVYFLHVIYVVKNKCQENPSHKNRHTLCFTFFYYHFHIEALQGQGA